MRETMFKYLCEVTGLSVEQATVVVDSLMDGPVGGYVSYADALHKDHQAVHKYVMNKGKGHAVAVRSYFSKKRLIDSLDNGVFISALHNYSLVDNGHVWTTIGDINAEVSWGRQHVTIDGDGLISENADDNTNAIRWICNVMDCPAVAFTHVDTINSLIDRKYFSLYPVDTEENSVHTNYNDSNLIIELMKEVDELRDKNKQLLDLLTELKENV